MLHGMPLTDVYHCLDAWSTSKLLARLDLCDVRPPPRCTNPTSIAAPPLQPHHSTPQKVVPHSSKPPLPPGAPLFIAPSSRGGVSQQLWSLGIKAALLPVCEWLVENLCIPSAQLAAVTADLRGPAGGTKSGTLGSSGGSGAAGAAPCWSQLVPFEVAAIQMEMASPGALMPLKYETFGRVIVQVCVVRWW